MIKNYIFNFIKYNLIKEINDLLIKVISFNELKIVLKGHSHLKKFDAINLRKVFVMFKVIKGLFRFLKFNHLKS